MHFVISLQCDQFGLAVKLVTRRTSLQFGVSLLLSSKVVVFGHCLCDFSLYSQWDIKIASTTAHLNVETVWWWQCIVRKSRLSSPTSWDFGPCQYLFGDSSFSFPKYASMMRRSACMHHPSNGWQMIAQVSKVILGVFFRTHSFQTLLQSCMHAPPQQWVTDDCTSVKGNSGCVFSYPFVSNLAAVMHACTTPAMGDRWLHKCLR